MPELDELVACIETARERRNPDGDEGTGPDDYRSDQSLDATFGIGLGDAKSLVASHPSWNRTAGLPAVSRRSHRAFREVGSVETHPE